MDNIGWVFNWITNHIVYVSKCAISKKMLFESTFFPFFSNFYLKG